MHIKNLRWVQQGKKFQKEKKFLTFRLRQRTFGLRCSHEEIDHLHSNRHVTNMSPEKE